jgi:RNA 2',3'-cyclic 3'-phosphodiesterase
VRLFIAIEFAQEIRGRLEGFIAELWVLAPKAKWVRVENLHITLKFLGETGPEKLPAIQAALASVRDSQPVTLELRGLGFFPNEQRARVF